MRLLLDSHALLWTIYAPDRLSARVTSLLRDGENELVVSHATVWELLSKVGRGKLRLTGSSVEGVMERIVALGAKFIPVQLNQIVLSASLPHHHSDPFDRMLIAQAMTEGLPLITADRTLSDYEIETIWN